MIAVDTNILVYAHRIEMKLHKQALEALEGLLAANDQWAIPWPCVHEFIAIVTNPRIFKTPTPLRMAFDVVRSWTQGANLYFLAEGEGYLALVEEISTAALLYGAKIHDARIAALCLHHGIKELWSSDRDFSLFPRLKLHNPLIK
jgi:hypothetical protein